MLQEEFEYYLENQEELVKKNFSRFIIIKGKSVLGDYGNEVEAILSARNDFGLELGTFLVQQCMPGVENYTQYFHSRPILVF